MNCAPATISFEAVPGYATSENRLCAESSPRYHFLEAARPAGAFSGITNGQESTGCHDSLSVLQ